MKSKKVLIGLIVAAFVGGFNYVSAQPKANYQNNLIEIGPDNISGRVRSIVVDKADPSNTTIYAGGVAGGLYKKTGDDNWEFVPCVINGKQVTLPISYMIQLPDNSLLIATGEGFEQHHGITSDRMSPKGRGLYRFTRTTESSRLCPVQTLLPTADGNISTIWIASNVTVTLMSMLPPMAVCSLSYGIPKIPIGTQYLLL